MSYFEYSSDHLYTAPVAEIFIGKPFQNPSIGPIETMIDTGSDYTILPLQFMEQLQLAFDDKKRVRGLWGGVRVVKIYTVSLKIAGFSFDEIYIIADAENKESLLGRNVLNLLKIVLDGPGQHTQIVSK